MDVVETAAAAADLLQNARAAGRSVGLVPTMGALHEGHISLVARARAECDVVAATIFVNPLQFGDPEDIAKYPRPLERDLDVLRQAGADVVFAPTVREMYPSWPEPPATTVSVHGVSDRWEGASRPGHFDGVATVVAKLFAVAGRCRAYFGLKDFQQLAVVRAMAADLSLPIEIVGCPIVREPDGLALSSRNVRLSEEERAAAAVLSRALATARAAIATGERSGPALTRRMRDVVATEPLVDLDYGIAVNAATLEEAVDIDDPATVRLLVAAEVGPVRLIDNSAALDALVALENAAPTTTVPPAQDQDQDQDRQLERTA
ncbi:MAG TPA: pantoate--beta-alanine ligase [Acidimicrobiales bacterium]|nr:pantoate--beta-alanine ligase [Acidimicrobiales bacterium]